MRIVVTGSKGFIGSKLCKVLRSLNHEVIEIDLSLGHNVEDWNDFENLPKFDYLVHLAAKIFVPESFDKPRSFYQTNIIGTLNAIEACRVNDAKLIFFSSYAYGAPDYLPIDEQHPIKSFNPYSRSKIMGEDICKSYFADFGVKSIVFRPFNIYGPNQDSKFLIPSIIEQALQGSITLKDNRPKRDYIYIDDIIDAVVKALDYEPNGSDVFNLASGKSFSVEEVVNYTKAIIGNEISVNYLNEHRPNEVLDTIAEISKAKELLNWEPKIKLESGIVRCIENKDSK
jgi:UDP-glucose 4-epimerase